MDKALNLQILHHNKHIAKKPDDEIPVPGEKRSKISGSGRWQQMLPTTFLRVAFSHPASCETALDKEFKLGNGVSARARVAGALMLYKMQTESVNAVVCRTPAIVSNFIIFQFMFDNATFHVKVPPVRAHTHPIMGAHGMLTFRQNDHVYNEEIVFPSTALWDETGESMLAVIKRHCPWAVDPPCNAGAPPPLRCFVAVLSGCDGGKNNDRLINYLIGVSKHFVMKGGCRNHSIALSLEPISKYLQIICPAFCTIKRLHSSSFHTKVIKGLHYIIDRNMVMLTPEKDPWYAPCPKDRAYAETVLELTYYQRDLHLSYIDDETRDSLAKDDAARRAKGQMLLQILPGNWRSKVITCWARGEFAGISREEAVVIILQAYLDVCPHIISVPALNKWLTLLASFADCSRGCHTPAHISSSLVQDWI